MSIYRHGVVVITTAQLHSTKSELRLCTGSKPACGMLEIWRKRLSSVNDSAKTTHHHVFVTVDIGCYLCCLIKLGGNGLI